LSDINKYCKSRNQYIPIVHMSKHPHGAFQCRSPHFRINRVNNYSPSNPYFTSRGNGVTVDKVDRFYAPLLLQSFLYNVFAYYWSQTLYSVIRAAWNKNKRWMHS